MARLTRRLVAAIGILLFVMLGLAGSPVHARPRTHNYDQIAQDALGPTSKLQASVPPRAIAHARALAAALALECVPSHRQFSKYHTEWRLGLVASKSSECFATAWCDAAFLMKVLVERSGGRL
jgi:hypothetical protein